MLIVFASLVVTAIVSMATPIIRTTFYFGRAWMALQIAPNSTAEGRRFHLLEFRWVRAILHTVNTTFATFCNLMATTTRVMIRHFGLTTALNRLRYTSATITEATRLALFAVAPLVPIYDPGSSGHMEGDTTTIFHGNERSSPDSNMLSGVRPGKSPHFTLSPAPA